MESRSKFACLYIDDDSDEDFTVGNKLTSKKIGHCGGVKQVKGSGGLVVHAVQKRPKTKKGNKEKVVDGATGLIVQGAGDQYFADEKYRENVRQAMRESAQLSKNNSSLTQPKRNATSDLENKEMDDDKVLLLDKILRPFEDKLCTEDSPSFNCEENTDPKGIEFYKNKLAEAAEQMAMVKEKAQSAQAELEKYKTRYRKLVDLFRDAEVSEKAKLVMEVDKARTSEAELASQLVEMQEELEQYKSKLRSLGALK